jgi:hypothetical protein
VYQVAFYLLIETLLPMHHTLSCGAQQFIDANVLLLRTLGWPV